MRRDFSRANRLQAASSTCRIRPHSLLWTCSTRSPVSRCWICAPRRAVRRPTSPRRCRIAGASSRLICRAHGSRPSGETAGGWGRRLGVTIVATLACAGTHLDRCLRGEEFDRVLVDAPCSNTGVLRRRADLRWRIEEREISRLATLQEKLLVSAAPFTKSQGILVYSTCSLEEEENQDT